MTTGDYFSCAKHEVPDLIRRAEEERDKILKEFSVFFSGNTSIEIKPVLHPFSGWAITGELRFNGDLVKAYDPIDLCFLDLNEMMLRRMMEVRNENQFI